jgi:ribosomal protein S18 acetylase RimI-like enzyme
MGNPDFHVRRGTTHDAAGISHVLQTIARERVYSAIERAWTPDEQRSYLVSLSDREAFYVAFAPSGDLIGYQVMDLYSPLLTSMAHVAQLGTYLLPAWRGRGVGRALFGETTQFARSAGYRKIVIQVRASNLTAQAFYRSLGFVECGRLKDQVIIDNHMDDEILLEYFL